MVYSLGVIKTGGKQYLVKKGEELWVEKLAGETGEKIEFDQVLLLVDKNGKINLGTPFLEKTEISAEILEQGQGPKLQGIRYYQKRHKRKYGHRQQLTRIKITEF